MGKSVADEKKQKVGIIIDIFGNIKNPYAKVLLKKGKDTISSGTGIFMR
jgi:rRNA processing protein Gar1